MSTAQDHLTQAEETEYRARAAEKKERLAEYFAEKAQQEREKRCRRMKPRGHFWDRSPAGTFRECLCCGRREYREYGYSDWSAWIRIRLHEPYPKEKR